MPGPLRVAPWGKVRASRRSALLTLSGYSAGARWRNLREGRSSSPHANIAYRQGAKGCAGLKGNPVAHILRITGSPPVDRRIGITQRQDRGTCCHAKRRGGVALIRHKSWPGRAMAFIQPAKRRGRVDWGVGKSRTSKASAHQSSAQYHCVEESTLRLQAALAASVGFWPRRAPLRQRCENGRLYCARRVGF